ncbi:hypothetical protein FRC17_003150 [Serendipita sp. 399]|nr:hypothetical protein FRC17_003150 [Serendipita sp. 399]
MSSSTERDPLLPFVSAADASSKKTKTATVPVVAVAPVSSLPVEREASNDLNQPTRRKLFWIFGAVWIAVFLGSMDTTITATLQQPVADYYKQSHRSSYVGASYLLAVCCFSPLYGRLSDTLGRKQAMLLAMFLFTLGTLLCGVAPSMEYFLAARLLAGMGGGGILTVCNVITTDLIPLRDRGVVHGIGAIMFGAGAGVGGPLGGGIADTFGWRTAFFFQVPLLLISSLLIAIHVEVVLPRTPLTLKQKLARIDWLGSITLVGFVSGLLIGLNLKETGDLKWSDQRVSGLLIASGISLGAFIVVELKISPEPVMPLRLLLSRTPLAVSLTNLLMAMISFSVLYHVPLYFMAVRLRTTSEAGLHLLPNSIAITVGSLGAGWLMRHTGRYYWLTVGSTALILITTILLAQWDEKDLPSIHSWLDIVPNGLGVSSTISSTTTAIIACVAQDDTAVAIGMMYLFRTTGQVLGVSLLGTLFQSVLMTKLREKIHGSNSRQIIETIRRDASTVRTLEGAQRQAAVESFALALRAVFLCQVAVAIFAVIFALPIEERPLPGSHEEHEEHQEHQAEQ